MKVFNLREIAVILLAISGLANAEESSLLDSATMSKNDVWPGIIWNDKAGIDGNFKSLLSSDWSDPHGEGSREFAF